MKTITIYPAKELNSDRLILTRRVFGEQLRDILKSRGKSLEYLESVYDTINIDISDVNIINQSFFSGAFRSRVSELGELGEYGFKNKYKFICKDSLPEKYINEMIEHEFHDVLLEKTYDSIRKSMEKELNTKDDYLELIIIGLIITGLFLIVMLNIG